MNKKAEFYKQIWQQIGMNALNLFQLYYDICTLNNAPRWPNESKENVFLTVFIWKQYHD